MSMIVDAVSQGASHVSGPTITIQLSRMHFSSMIMWKDFEILSYAYTHTCTRLLHRAHIQVICLQMHYYCWLWAKKDFFPFRLHAMEFLLFFIFFGDRSMKPLFWTSIPFKNVCFPSFIAVSVLCLLHCLPTEREARNMANKSSVVR